MHVFVGQHFSVCFLEWRPGRIKYQSVTVIGTTPIAGENYKFFHQWITVGT